MHFLRWIACSCAMTLVAWGQAESSSGDLKGTVVDPSGASMANAKITVTDPQRGLVRSVETNSMGEFLVPLLPASVYTVRVESPGFVTKVLEKVEIRVGDTFVLRVPMEIGTVNTEMTITAAAPVVDFERTQQASILDSRRIENLPINRRNYLDFALLSPGVTPTNDLVDGTDYRVAQTPQSGMNFGGGNGRGNAFTVDGVENILNSGGVRNSFSQEVVQEFQVNRNSFTAEFGGSVGGAINVVTKSGTNDFHGNLFGFLRNRAIQARNYFDSGKSAYTRGQYGATLSAPIKRDRTFFFVGFERLDRHETAFVPILWDRSVFSKMTASQQQVADVLSGIPSLRPLALGMQKALVTNNFPQTLQLFNSNSGDFPFSETDQRASARVDHRFSDNDSFFVRASWSQDRNQNSQFGALLGFNRGRDLWLGDRALMVSNTWVMSPSWVSETRFMWNYGILTIHPKDPYGPELTITGFGGFGREYLLPHDSWETHLQFIQNFNYTAGKHALKFGFDIDPVRDRVRGQLFFGGRFQFGEIVPLGSILISLSGDPNINTTVAGALAAAGKQSLIANLSAPINALQAYNLGLPTMYQQGFGDPNWIGWFKRNNFFIEDSYRIRPNFTLNIGARYEAEIGPPNVPFDPNNIAPRVGFAWTPVPNGKTVIRGGYGIFYAPHYSQEANSPGTLDGKHIMQVFITPLGIPGVTNPLTGKPLTSFDVYQTLLKKGFFGTRTITTADIAPLGLQPGLTAPGRVLFGVAKNYVNAYSQQASFEIERAFGDVAVSAGYTFNRGLHLPRVLDENLYYTGGRTLLNQPIFGRYDPSILQNNIFESVANSFYHALTLQAAKRFSRNFALNANYTFSKSVDEVLDFNSDFEPNDQLNARAERSLSSFHQKHRFVAYAMIESPYLAKGQSGFAHKFFGDFVVSPIFSANSGRPFNLLAGYDTLGDNHPTTHRPLNVGRNVGLGPDYFSFDLRLARKFPLNADGQKNLEFTAEGFNLLNRTNFKSINNTVGTLDLTKLARPITGVRGVPTDPLSFTSAYDPRQFQFGLKINF